MESNEANKSTSYTEFKLDFPSPPSSWESFEDFKSSFGDIDFDVEKFLEDLKSDSFDDDIFESKKKKKQQEENTQLAEEARSGMKPANIPFIIIPPSLNATEVKFELFFPKSVSNNTYLTNASIIPIYSTLATPYSDSDYLERTLTIPAPSTTNPQITPSSEFREYQGNIKYTSQRPDEEVTKNDIIIKTPSNRRSHDYEMPRQRPSMRSHGQIRRNMWRGKTTTGERKLSRGPTRGNARFTLKSPRYFVMNTTPNYNSEKKPRFENVNPTSVYVVKNSQQEIGPRFNGLNAKPTSFTDNQEYRYSYATHYNSALHRPNQNNINDMQAFELTTPRQMIESDSIENKRHSDQERQNPYDLHEQSPDYRRRRQNLYRRQNRVYKFYRPGGKSENLIRTHSTIQPIVVRNSNSFENMNYNPVYTGKFSSETTVDHNEGSENKADFPRPTNIPSYEIQTTQQLSSMKKPVPTAYFDTGSSQLSEGIYHPKEDKKVSHTTESTFLYDEQLEINNKEDWLTRNHSRHDTSPYNTKAKVSDSVTYLSPSHNTEPSYPPFRYTVKSNRDEYNRIQDSTTNEKHNTEIKNPSPSTTFGKLNATVAYPDYKENHQPIKMNDQLSPTTSYQLNIQQQYPQNHKFSHSSKSDSSTETLEHTNSGYTNNSSATAKKPSSYFYVNQKIGPVKKIAIFNNIPSDNSNDDDYDYYNDYDEEDYEDIGNETTPKPPQIPKILQTIDYQEFEDPEYEDYNDDETDYDDESKESSGNEMGSGEDYYDDDDEEKEEIKEGETKNVKVEAKSQEVSLERPQTATPRPGCIFAGRAGNGQKRLLCPRRNSTDRPNTTADDQTNSEQTRRTITLLR